MFDVTGLFTVFIIVVLSVCVNLRVCVCVCNFNVYYLHVIYALTFVLTFMLTDKFFISLHPSMVCLIGMMHGSHFII
jgi:hypothetical protein